MELRTGGRQVGIIKLTTPRWWCPRKRTEDISRSVGTRHRRVDAPLSSLFPQRARRAANLECKICHPVAPPGSMAGIAGTNACMQCHVAIKTDRPHIARLADDEKKGEEIPWEVCTGYRTPSTCATNSTWPAAKQPGRPAMVRRRSETWYSKRKALPPLQGRMDCHRANDAPVDCDYCHEEL